ALLGRFGLRPARPSSAIHRAWVGQIYFGDNPAKWVRFTSALTASQLPVGQHAMVVPQRVV
ncbi:hypothetical protein, partial [Rubrivivax albus]|uniref:hypothetical protein n=1 Tax=Rubrivivax albus TaxID=2499835 RepID=UPI001E5368EB